MTQRLKTLGLVLVVGFSISAIGASMAQATSFTSAGYPATVSGEQVGAVNEFETEIGNVECEESTFSGSLAAASSTLSITPTYNECMVGGLVPAFIEMEGCTYLLHATGAKEGTFDIVCPTGKHPTIRIPLANCRITFTAQVNLKNIEITLSFPGLTIHFGTITLTYHLDQTAPGGCFGKSGTRTNGRKTYTYKTIGSNGALGYD